MFTEEHDAREDKMVWLSTDEVETLLATPDDETKRIAYALGVRCGLRSEEIADIRPGDIQTDSEAGEYLIVRDGKGGKYRETPIPSPLANTIQTAAEYRAEPEDYPIVTSQSSSPGASTRTLRNWMVNTREQLVKETGDDRWQYLTFHDLRRTWATLLRGNEVDSLLVCDWGGWNDIDTFLDHYRGSYAPDVQARERQKVAWL